MSTRATYLILDNDNKEAIGLYGHCDGYPSGAAKRFKAALALNPAKRYGMFAECLLRADIGMIITDEDHEMHSDTEYRYTIKHIDQRTITVQAMRGYESSWETFFTGLVEDFIEQFENHVETEDE